jgi:ubiquinone/menaquinone biosynthesis C-methylase UbiE
MTLVMDPAGNEIRALEKAAPWRGQRVVEIGCGNGRLTLRLAALGTRSIEAIDPSTAAIRQARRKLPKLYQERIAYHVGHAEKLRYAPGTFDIAVFAWVL